jgi:hypothetical protein
MLVSVRLDIMLILRHDRCTICAKLPIGSEIILDTLDSTPTSEAQVEACFGPFGDSATQDRCTIYTERTTGL